MAYSGQITVTFYLALQESVERQAGLVCTGWVSSLVVVPGLSVEDLLWFYHLIQLAA